MILASSQPPVQVRNFTRQWEWASGVGPSVVSVGKVSERLWTMHTSWALSVHLSQMYWSPQSIQGRMVLFLCSWLTLTIKYFTVSQRLGPHFRILLSVSFPISLAIDTCYFRAHQPKSIKSNHFKRQSWIFPYLSDNVKTNMEHCHINDL